MANYLKEFKIIPHETDVEEMNKILATMGGHFHDGRPFWRIVWSNNQYEFRRGMFDTYHDETGIWIERKWHESLRVKKYQHEDLQNRYLLEKLHLDDTPDVVNEGMYRYNAVYVFRDDRNGYQKPIMEVCQMAIYAWKNHVSRPNKSDYELQEDWMKSQYEKNRTAVENIPEPKTINWKPVKTEVKDLGRDSLKR